MGAVIQTSALGKQHVSENINIHINGLSCDAVNWQVQGRAANIAICDLEIVSKISLFVKQVAYPPLSNFSISG